MYQSEMELKEKNTKANIHIELSIDALCVDIRNSEQVYHIPAIIKLCRHESIHIGT